MNPPNLNHKPFRILLIIALAALMLSTPAIFIQSTSAQTEQATQYYDKSFAWDYNGKHWTWNLSIPKTLYNVYKSVPIFTRTHSGPSGYGFLTTTEDYYIKSLADKLNETATSQGYGSYDKVSFALAFVQSLQYTSDNVTEGYNEYPRFPIETLVDEGGDCEDTSILFATITLIMGYGTVYINPPDHYAVGILGNGLTGTSWTYPEGSNRTYYYCETTGSGFKIGQLPAAFIGQNAYIYPIDQSRQYVPSVAVVPTPEPIPTGSTVSTTSTPAPTVTDPDIQKAKPLSLNLITEYPLASAAILALIAFSVVLAIWSVRKSKHTGADEASSDSTAESIETESTEDKFCIYCGQNNKGYAAYCEKCGKQIG